MINPWKVHSARATVFELPKGLYQTYKVKLDWNGAIVEGYDLPARFNVGDQVCDFSITGQRYMIRSIRRAPALKLLVSA